MVLFSLILPTIGVFVTVGYLIRDNSFSTFAKFSENYHFLTPDTLTYVCISVGNKY